MKAILLLEFETFIKKKQFIFPLLYILFSICTLFYILKEKTNSYNHLMIVFSSNLIMDFAKNERPLKKVIRLLPIKAKERVSILFLEIFMLNIIIFFGLSISYFPYKEVGTILVVLYICAIYYCVDWGFSNSCYFANQYVASKLFWAFVYVASCDWCCCTYLYKNKYSSYYSVFGICNCSLYASVHLIHSYLD